MTDVDKILAQLPIDQIGAQLGLSADQVKKAAAAAVPMLLGGMNANAQNPSGAASLASALQGHVDRSTAFEAIDPAEGAKITQHILGSGADSTIRAAAGTVDSGLIQKLLPYLAPIVLAYIAKQTASKAGGGALGDVLGQVLGGAVSGGTTSKSSSGILGKILEMLFKR